jgi:hypothetical protein
VGRRRTGGEAAGRAAGRRRQQPAAPRSAASPVGPVQPSAAVTELQQQAGNRAVAGLVVQRFELGDVFDAVARSGGGIASILALGASLLTSKDREATLLDGLVRAGFTDRSKLTNIVFWLRHPDRMGGKIESGEDDLAAEWKAIRRSKVDPALARGRTGPGGSSGGSPSAGSSTKADDPAVKPLPSAKPMSEEERERLVEAAKTQGSSGTAAITAQMERALPEGVTLDDWFADHVPDATFLGLRIRASGGKSPGVHARFLAALQKAEAALRAKFPGDDDGLIRAKLGVRDIGGLRPPKLATGGSLPSMHCFGMAIDIDAATNPFVGNQGVSKKVKDPAERAKIAANRSPRIIERAMLLLHGERFDVESRLAAKTVEEAYDIHARASQALADYLKLADAGDAELLPLVTRAQTAGDTNDLAWWRERITTDKAMLPHFDFGRHDNPEEKGYMNLDKELVLALTKDAGLLWGGTYAGAKDMMHFDLRDGTIRRKK